MDSRIGHLHCRYRLFGDRNQAGAASARLERVARDTRDGLLESYAQAIEQVLGDDPTIYVIRHIRHGTAVPLARIDDDRALTRRWADSLAGAVVRTIAGGEHSGNNLIKFRDQAAYVAQFIRDLLADQAWDRWFYGAFRYLREFSVERALYRVLLDNKPYLPYILTELTQRGVLSELLKRLHGWPLLMFWDLGVRSEALGAAASARLVKELIRHWAASDRLPTPEEAADPAALRRWLMALGDIPDLPTPELMAFLQTEYPRWLEEQRRAGQLPASTDKTERPVAASCDQDAGESPRDARSRQRPDRHARQRHDQLSGTAYSGETDRPLFTQTCQLITVLGLWRSPPTDIEALLANYRPGQIADWSDRQSLTDYVEDVLGFFDNRGLLQHFNGVVPIDFSRRLEQKLAVFDWLDTERLRQSIWHLINGAQASRGHRRPTAKQRHLLADLRNVLKRQARQISANADPVAIKVHLYAALLDDHPHWAGDALAVRLLDALADALATDSGKGPGGASDTQVVLNVFGPETQDLLAALGATSEGAAIRVQTPCAGALLLLRTIADVRLPMLAPMLAPASDDLPVADPFHFVLLPLLARLGGEGAIHKGRLDQALALLAGPHTQLDWSAWTVSWRAPCSGDGSEQDSGVGEGSPNAALLAALWRVLAGQRVLPAAGLHLHRLTLVERPIWVVGDGDSHCWPFWAYADETTPGALLELWGKACGSRPAVVTIDDPEAGDIQVQHPADLSAEDAVDAHRQNREALQAALASLEHAKLGVPEADLTLGLIAIALLRAWARWLPRFGDSSPSHLLANLIRRRGWLSVTPNAIDIILEPAPLDVIVEMAGYTAELEKLPWLDGRNVRYSVER